MTVSVAPKTSDAALLTASWRDALEDQGQRVTCVRQGGDGKQRRPGSWPLRWGWGWGAPEAPQRVGPGLLTTGTGLQGEEDGCLRVSRVKQDHNCIQDRSEDGKR